MAQPSIPKLRFSNWLLCSLALVLTLSLESCLLCCGGGELNRQIGKNDLRASAERSTVAKKSQAHSSQKISIESREK